MDRLRCPTTLSAGLALPLILSAQPFPEPEAPPNVIVVLTDDVGYNDIGAFTWPSQDNPSGSNPIPYAPSSYQPLAAPNAARTLTPRIDSLATNGIRLTNYYSSNPQCSPARASLLTGSYGYRVGIPNVLVPEQRGNGPTRGLAASERTLAELLKERGYATAAVGKWHLGDAPQYLPLHHGFDRFFGIGHSNDMWIGEPTFGPWGDLHLIEGENFVNYTTDSGGVITTPIDTPSEQAYLLEAMAEEALEFLDQATGGPFFLYFSPHTGHVPTYPHPDFLGASGVSWYYDCIAELDYRVGQLLDKLDALGERENTIVIFTSDNGPWLSRRRPSNPEQAAGSAYPLWGSKSTPWEGGMRVPFVAQWPRRIPAGIVSDGIGSHIDLLPTLVRFAGGLLPEDLVIDGSDLSPVLLGTGTDDATDTVHYFRSTGLYAVRDGDWKLWTRSGFEGNAGELFHLPSDIQERTNVFDSGTENVLSNIQSTFWSEIQTNQRAPGVTRSQGILVEDLNPSVPENGVANARIRLRQNPGGNLTVSAAMVSGDSDISLEGNVTVTFNSTNWNSWQSLPLNADDDPDTLVGVAVLQLSATAVPTRFVYPREADDDGIPSIELVKAEPRADYPILPDALHGMIVEVIPSINGVERPAGMVISWEEATGAAVVFDDPTAALTGVRFPVEGLYELRATVTFPGLADQAITFRVQVGPNAAIPPGQTLGEWIRSPLEDPGNGPFGSGFLNYRALADDLWHERYNLPANDGSADDRNSREVLQDEANDSVPTTDAGSHWLNLAPNSGYPEPAVYQTFGTKAVSSPDTFTVRFDLGDRSNNPFGSFRAELIATDAAFSGADGISLTSASGYRLLDATPTYDDLSPSWSGSGNRSLKGVEHTLSAVGWALGEQLWIRLRATGDGTQSLVDNLSVQAPLPLNVAPAILPGSDLTYAYTGPAPLIEATVSDDGQPAGSAIEYQWQTAPGGPQAINFADSASLSTVASLQYPGTVVARLLASDGDITVFREQLVTREPLSFEEWVILQDLPPGQRDPDDNFDGDRFTHAWEFVFGLSASDSEPGPFPWTITQQGDEIHLTLDIPRDRLPNLAVERTTDFVTGSEVSAAPSIDPIDDEWNRWTWVIPIDGADRGFFQLRWLVE